MYNLTVTMGGVSKKVAEAMEKVLALKIDEVTEEEVMMKGVPQGMEKYSAELFRTLCQLTTGEANTVVRGSEQEGKRNGYVALKMLAHRFNAKSPAKLYRTLLEVLKPGALKDVREVAKGVQ